MYLLGAQEEHRPAAGRTVVDGHPHELVVVPVRFELDQCGVFAGAAEAACLLVSVHGVSVPDLILKSLDDDSEGQLTAPAVPGAACRGCVRAVPTELR
jgi:hypothetical protein